MSLSSSYELDINNDKSTICFSKNSKNYNIISTTLNINLGSFPLKYLGIPLSVGIPKASHFSPLLDEIFKWFVGWKSKFLYFGGKLKLIRSTINNYLSYWLGFWQFLNTFLRESLLWHPKFLCGLSLC